MNKLEDYDTFKPQEKKKVGKRFQVVGPINGVKTIFPTIKAASEAVGLDPRSLFKWLRVGRYGWRRIQNLN